MAVKTYDSDGKLLKVTPTEPAPPYTAKDARKTTNENRLKFSVVYDAIQDAACEGMSELRYDMNSGNVMSVKDLREDLRRNGYDVNLEIHRRNKDYCDVLVIKW